MEANFKNEVRSYIKYLEDTRNETWYDFVKPIKTVLNNVEISDFDKIQILTNINSLFVQKTKQWKFESEIFSA